MRVILRFAHDPQNLDALNALLIDDMRELNRQGRNGCVSAIIQMLRDLRETGTECRYIKPLGGSLYELKTRSEVGAPRIYFFIQEGLAVLCRAECKRETKASAHLLLQTARILVQRRINIPAVLGQ